MHERLSPPGVRHLVTVGPAGAPQVSPVRPGLEGEYAMAGTALGRVREENPRRNPNVSLSHPDPQNPRLPVDERQVKLVWVSGGVEAGVAGLGSRAPLAVGAGVRSSGFVTP